MSQQGYALVGLTGLVAGLIGVLVFAMLRLMAAARDMRGHLRASGMETALLSSALEEAIGRLKAQERAMAARAEASERLSGEIVASLTAGLVVTGLDGEIRILNPSSRRLLGLADRPVAGPLRAVLGTVSPLADVIEDCLRTGQPILRRTVEIQDPLGRATHLGVTVSPLLDEHRAPAGVICLFTDLTEVMALEEQLRLKDALARLGELTAGIAHEFRNGLATIHGYARLIEADSLPEAERRYLDGIRNETDALGQVVTNFLAFARPAELTLGAVDLGTLIARAAEEIRSDAESRGGQVTVAGTFGTVEGDEVLLRQAFSNLARNALEACADAGVVPDIRLAGHVDARARQIGVEVSDNGPGIPPEERERIFRPFFTTKRQGTGLGLALVQKIVITHNGRVQVGGPAGRGARVRVTLPLSPVAGGS